MSVSELLSPNIFISLLLQAHFCHIPGDHTFGLNCLSDSQVLPLLLAMDANTLLACGRTSSQLLRLLRDREVWRHLLRETDELTNALCGYPIVKMEIRYVKSFEK